MFSSAATVPLTHEAPPQSGLFPILLGSYSTPDVANDDGAQTADEVRVQLADYLPALRRRARYLARNHAEAEDLIQDTAERALRFAPSYRPGTNLRAWLQQILYTVFASRCRRSQRARAVHAALGQDPHLHLSQRDAAPDGQVVLSGFVRELQALPEVYARVLWLVDYQDYAYAEAAEQLSVPLGTVMSRLHRARRMLRDALDPQTHVG